MSRLATAEHAEELARELERLVGFFARPEGLDRMRWRQLDGTVDHSRPIALYSTARLAHCFLFCSALGIPGASAGADDAVSVLLDRYFDPEAGAFADELDARGDRLPGPRSAYGHAFVLLAGASAVRCGHPDGARLYGLAETAIDRLFWDDAIGAAVDQVAADGRPAGDYRGQNANMHLVEAALAAYEATGDSRWLERGRRLARRFVLDVAPRSTWRVPEHYTADWQVDADFGTPADPFRPSGTLPGHSLEWARLLAYLAVLDPANAAGWEEAARALVDRALADGWDEERGGLVYSVGFDGRPLNRHRMHWATAEGLGAAASLYALTGDDRYRRIYQRFWEFATAHLIDREGGSWWHELDAENRPDLSTWDGKPDLYHAAQATLYARIDRPRGVVDAVRSGDLGFGRDTAR